MGELGGQIARKWLSMKKTAPHGDPRRDIRSPWRQLAFHPIDGGPISWKASREGGVTLSSSEAEFAVIEYVHSALHLKSTPVDGVLFLINSLSHTNIHKQVCTRVACNKETEYSYTERVRERAGAKGLRDTESEAENERARKRTNEQE